jgi:hypothetical protein
MKKVTYLLQLLAVAMLFLVSCGKDGAIGPQGPTGAQGAVGPAGPAGANGQPGSVIYSGTTMPAATTGAIGDFYLNISTGLLYGPKTTTGWGMGFSLIGPAGAAGAAGIAGNTIRNGIGTPSVTLGNIGDYYLDKTDYMLYGPKTILGWGMGLSLQGPEGNANVLTDVFTVNGGDWMNLDGYDYGLPPAYDDQVFTNYYIRKNNSITQDILDNGLVLVYFTPNLEENANAWAPLPYQSAPANGYGVDYVYVTSPGQVELEYYFAPIDATAITPRLTGYEDLTRKFKIVTVSGQAGVFMLAHHVNLNNYQEVSKVTGIWQQDKQ